jgi:NAD(P)H-flavin reductase
MMVAEVQNIYLPRLFTIQRMIKETQDTFTMVLGPLDGGTFSFRPGQFNMVYMFGIGEVPISISGDPSEARTLTHTIRAVGGVTKAMAQLKKGDTLGIRGPYGTAWPLEAAKGNDLVIICGGIGLVPLRPVLYEALAHRDDYGKMLMLYGARTPKDMPYVKELEQWRGRFDMHVSVIVDRAESSWRGNVGVVTSLLSKFKIDGEQTIAMVCGPEIMMRFTIHDLIKRTMPAENIYLSMERNMKCGVGLCGHCQWGPTFICKDGPVYSYRAVKELMVRREI